MIKKKGKKMTKKEKKKYLDMDLIDRMVRIEQKVASSFSQNISFEDTDYFKDLSTKEKKKYRKFRKKKHKKKKRWALISLGILLGVLAFFVVLNGGLDGGMTGQVIGKAVKDTAGSGGLALIETLLLILGAALLTIIAITILAGRKLEKKMKDHISIIDDFLSKKGSK